MTTPKLTDLLRIITAIIMDKTNHIIPNWPAPANVRACITTRNGGVSVAPYASNNFGLHVGDDLQAVTQNRATLCELLGLSKTPQWLEQIHGVKVVDAKSDGLVRTADGSYSTEKGQACLVMTADCLPILLCDQNGSQVAAIHCGWRSLAKGITARALDKFSGSPKNILAYLGPAISQPHFEVGVDVLEAFFESALSPEHADAIAKAFISSPRPLHFYADIYALARAELNALGVTRIYGGDYCTFAQADDFYSYRRDKVTGRMASLIWLAE
jgi:polyphenol oxidase